MRTFSAFAVAALLCCGAFAFNHESRPAPAHCRMPNPNTKKCVELSALTSIPCSNLANAGDCSGAQWKERMEWPDGSVHGWGLVETEEEDCFRFIPCTWDDDESGCVLDDPNAGPWNVADKVVAKSGALGDCVEPLTPVPVD